MFRNLSTYVLALLLGLPAVALAQGTGTLAGRVIDDTGVGLPGANVIVDGTTLGAATDADGNYRVIGIPVGEYSVTASYTGFRSVQQSGVSINNGYTRTLDFSLAAGDIELGVIDVVYERPLIAPDAIGTPRVVSGDDIANLPVRGVQNIAALQSGVTTTEGTNDLFIRGGREQEVSYFVDGVRVNVGALGVNTLAIQEQEMLIGTIPARYGDVQSGVIAVTTRSGTNEFFGSAEAITSEALDAFGYNNVSLNFGGPIVPGRVGFFLTSQYLDVADNSPYFDSVFALTDDAFANLQANPQYIQIRNGAGDVEFVPFNAGSVVPGTTTAQQIVTNPGAYGITLPAGFQIATNGDSSAVSLTSAAQFLGEGSFTTNRAKRDPFQNLTLGGNMTFNLGSSFDIRVGGTVDRQRSDPYSYRRSFFLADRYYNLDDNTTRFYTTFRQRLGTSAFYQLQGEFNDFRRHQYANGTSADPAQALVQYGDIADPINAVASHYYTTDANGVLQVTSNDGEQFSVSSPFGLFTGAGVPLGTFQQRHDQSYRFSGAATVQMGIHQLEFGGEYEQQTRRLFEIASTRISNYINDPSDPFSPGCENTPCANSYEELPLAAFGSFSSTAYRYYGYNYLGTNEVDSEDLDAYYATGAAGDAFDIAPYRPVYYGGYLSDKIEYRDLVLQLGLRVDVFDNNTQVPRDIYAPYSIIRAGGQELTDPTSDYYQGPNFALPGVIEDDYAVYFDESGAVIGYRDLTGRFYDATGNTINPANVQEAIGNNNGRTVTVGQQRLTADAFTEYDPEVTFMPRIGVSFPVTDRALFFASYNVTSQRPTEQAFAPFPLFAGLTGQDRIPNPALRPERTTQYELGFRQRLGERAAFTLSGFYRTQQNKVNVRQLLSGEPQYSTFLNSDFTTSKGVEVGFELRRTNNLALNVNYTLSYAAGTGSDANSTGRIAWLGGFIPDAIYTADFDRRHVFNATMDYRFGEGEGPMIGGMRLLENFGASLIANIQSGTPYTPVVSAGNIIDAAQLGDAVGQLNSLRLPGSALLNLRVDRAFNLGPANLRGYVWVQNLLNSRVTTAIYRSTGTTQEEYLEQFVSQQGTGFGESAAFQYSQFANGPIPLSAGGFTAGAGRFYALPRQIRLGVLLDF
ncbi:MAG TPA: TonB-dependent receptor [Rhodothermales bacterium]|nr:TonB-dependent receptor [Rhodothermales bacterium]